MTDEPISGPAWIPIFLQALSATRMVKSATAAAGRTPRAIYFQRQRNLRFAQAWEAALADPPPPHSTRKTPRATSDKTPGKAPSKTLRIHPEQHGTRPPTKRAPARAYNAGWRALFLEQLAQTSNVKAAAAYANVPLATVYARKQKDRGFAAKWRKALFEGYEQLEMEVLAALRGNLPDQKIDLVHAIRQLALHRKTAAEMRGLEEAGDDTAVLDAIDSLFRKVRETAPQGGPDDV